MVVSLMSKYTNNKQQWWKDRSRVEIHDDLLCNDLTTGWDGAIRAYEGNKGLLGQLGPMVLGCRLLACYNLSGVNEVRYCS